MEYRPIDRESNPWDECFLYPEDIMVSSDEHEAAHALLFELTRALPSDSEPYGINKRSPCGGLLTFEHQGCPEFERGPEKTDAGRSQKNGT